VELSQRRARLIQHLRKRKSREREGLVLVEGVRAVTEALDAGARVSFAVAAPIAGASEMGRDVIDRLADVEVVDVDDKTLVSISDTERPQGIVLVCEQPESDASRVVSTSTLILDAIQDPGNVGALIRSAVAFGFGGVVVLDGTGDPWGAKAVRAAAGMTFHIPVHSCDADSAIAAVSEMGSTLYCASAEGKPLRGPRQGHGTSTGGAGFALVLGNEGAGVRPVLREAADSIVSVEMNGAAESLNVGIAGSILMHELTRTDE
jgi:RNA methyltransferase, TrmH family